MERNNQCTRSLVKHPHPLRVILGIEDKLVLPWRQRLEKDTCLSYNLVTMPTDSSHFFVIKEAQMYSDKYKGILFLLGKKCLLL